MPVIPRCEPQTEVRDENLLYGCHGRYLWVDVSRQEVRACRLSERVLRRYLGGSGLATYLLLQHAGADHGPLEPQAPLVFAFSPLVGSPLTTSAKFAVASRSPLTNYINDSLVSSAFALAGKRTGFDALVITGRCESPHVLVIDDGTWRLLPGERYWGLACSDAEQRLRAELGPEYQLAVVGPAAEQGVRYATISHDGRHAGRGGNGSVLGAKRLKAIAVRGSQRVNWAHPEQLVRAAKDLSKRSFGPATAKYRELGTAANLLVLNRLHALPTRNFQQGTFEGVEQLDLTASKPELHPHTRASCAACTIGCEHMYQPANAGTSQRPVRVEYENLFALGPMCGVSDVDAVLKASQMCDEIGIDTISAGGTIAFGMECAERGWWEVPWLRFGDPQALLTAIEMIGRGDGIGPDLGLGSRALAEKLGPHTRAIAPHVKGLELPGYEPRAAQAMGLGFAVGTRGADHNRSGAYQVDFSESVNRRQLRAEDVHHVVATEDQAAILDSAIFCKFLRGVFSDLYVEGAEYLRWVTGWDITADELQQTAQRIVAIKKLFNIRAGWQPSEDTLPARLLQQPQADDAESHLSASQLQALVHAYNVARGWTQEGWIPAELIEQLGLEDVHDGPVAQDATGAAR